MQHTAPLHNTWNRIVSYRIVSYRIGPDRIEKYVSYRIIPSHLTSHRPLHKSVPVRMPVPVCVCCYFEIMLVNMMNIISRC
jgi:hypothetical protein